MEIAHAVVVIRDWLLFLTPNQSEYCNSGQSPSLKSPVTHLSVAVNDPVEMLLLLYCLGVENAAAVCSVGSIGCCNVDAIYTVVTRQLSHGETIGLAFRE